MRCRSEVENTFTLGLLVASLTTAILLAADLQVRAKDKMHCEMIFLPFFNWHLAKY